MQRALAKLHAFNRATALADKKPTEDLDPNYWIMEPDPEFKHHQHDAFASSSPDDRKKTVLQIPRLEISDMSIDDQDFRKI